MKQGITDAFRSYGATLKNQNWSVSSWIDSETLVVSLWNHHYLKDYEPGVLAFGDRFDRWSGLGNREFKENVTGAFESGAKVRLVIARTLETDRVQRGEDGSTIPKTFAVRKDLIGRVSLIAGEEYVIEFRRIAT